MIRYLGGKKVKIHPLLLKKIGSGMEGDVYNYNGDALKIYHSIEFDLDPKSLNIRDINYLKQIKTDRILLPKQELTKKDGKLCGYTTKFVNSDNVFGIYDLEKEKLIEELSAIKNELLLLSNNRVSIDDWIFNNSLFDGSLKLIDPGRYKVDYYKDKSIEQIKEENKIHFAGFIIHEIIGKVLYPDREDSVKRLNYLESMLFEFLSNEYDSIEELMDEKLSKVDNLREYVLKERKKAY